MTKSNVHAILGELHRLLSTYKSADFIEASNYGGNPRAMKAALRALASEAEPSADTSRRRIVAWKRVTKVPDDKSQVRNLILRSKIFESYRSIVTYAERLGLSLRARPKESRERLANRLASLIETLPDHQKSKVIDELFAGRNSQTQGWIEVIKSGKR